VPLLVLVDGADDEFKSAKGSVEPLTVTLENFGAEVDSSVNLKRRLHSKTKSTLSNAKPCRSCKINFEYVARNNQLKNAWLSCR